MASLVQNFKINLENLQQAATDIEVIENNLKDSLSNVSDSIDKITKDVWSGESKNTFTNTVKPQYDSGSKKIKENIKLLYEELSKDLLNNTVQCDLKALAFSTYFKGSLGPTLDSDDISCVESGKDPTKTSCDLVNSTIDELDVVLSTVSSVSLKTISFSLNQPVSTLRAQLSDDQETINTYKFKIDEYDSEIESLCQNALANFSKIQDDSSEVNSIDTSDISSYMLSVVSPFYAFRVKKYTVFAPYARKYSITADGHIYEVDQKGEVTFRFLTVDAKGNLTVQYKKLEGEISGEFLGQKTNAKGEVDFLYFDANGNLTISPTYAKASVNVRASAIHLEGSASIGDPSKLQAKISGEADVLTVKLDASASIGRNPLTGEIEAHAGIDAMAAVATASTTASVGNENIGNLEAKVEGYAGGIGIKANVGYEEGKFTASLGGSLGIGASIDVSFEPKGIVKDFLDLFTGGSGIKSETKTVYSKEYQQGTTWKNSYTSETNRDTGAKSSSTTKSSSNNNWNSSETTSTKKGKDESGKAYSSTTTTMQEGNYRVSETETGGVYDPLKEEYRRRGEWSDPNK